MYCGESGKTVKCGHQAYGGMTSENAWLMHETDTMEAISAPVRSMTAWEEKSYY